MNNIKDICDDLGTALHFNNDITLEFSQSDLADILMLIDIAKPRFTGYQVDAYKKLGDKILNAYNEADKKHTSLINHFKMFIDD